MSLKKLPIVASPFILLLITVTFCANPGPSLFQLRETVRIQPVFPGAAGFGVMTPAGRGGRIVKVTNLNDSGAGSLRDAIDSDGARIIVFEVSGTINLSENLEIKKPFITIAGQTAPSPGITLNGAGIIINTNDVLLQHLRIRPGDSPDGPSPSTRGSLQILNYSSCNVVVDHISASWAIDENVSTWNAPHDVTISNSIISEALNNSLHQEGAHSMGVLIGDYSRNIALIGNLLAHNVERNPRVKGGASLLLANNLMYNGGRSAWMVIGSVSAPNTLSIVSNVFIDGPDTPVGAKAIKVSDSSSPGSKIYLSGNLYTGQVFTYPKQHDPRVPVPPIWDDSIVLRDNDKVESWVLFNAGARPADRDLVDQRIINEVKNRAGRIVDSPEEVGGHPNFTPGFREFSVPLRPHGDDDGDGYTNIEEILQKMAALVE